MLYCPAAKSTRRPYARHANERMHSPVVGLFPRDLHGSKVHFSKQWLERRNRFTKLSGKRQNPDTAMELHLPNPRDLCEETKVLQGLQEEPEMDGRKPTLKSSQKVSLLSSSVRTVIRLRRTTQLLKKGVPSRDPPSKPLQRRQSLGKVKVGNQANFQSSQYFTFDTSAQPPQSSSKKKKKRPKNPRVLYPGCSRKYLPTEHKSKAKRCLLLLVGIVCFQILNAIENLDDNVAKYDLDGLEKTMRREVFGQDLAVEGVMGLLKDYLATHIHNKPLVISFHGPSGVGKSHVGWLLAKHFRSIMGHETVLHYFTQHHCPEGVPAMSCQLELSKMVTEMVTQAEVEEKIPLFILDEVESMPPDLLETLGRFFHTNQTNEFLNAVYILISNLGAKEVTDVLLQNVTMDLLQAQRTAEQLRTVLSPVLSQIHPLWMSAEIVPFVLLEKSHVRSCFYEEMMSEGIYPDPNHIERLVSQLGYYTKGELELAVTGCKPVVGKVNLL
nr:PREDICTED: torsin-4A isoform X1 [Anolis carolinensis]|eukprot:XP_016854499.1 PREDICTED: torsin-4A isoform X1 [Anolis carolinensis]